jgi:hypothetical protein
MERIYGLYPTPMQPSSKRTKALKTGWKYGFWSQNISIKDSPDGAVRDRLRAHCSRCLGH